MKQQLLALAALLAVGLIAGSALDDSSLVGSVLDAQEKTSESPATHLDIKLPAESLPARGLNRFGTTHLRHGSRILTLTFAPDGQTLAAGGGNDPVRLWNLRGGNTITLPEYWAQAITYTKRGAVLGAAGAFKKIRLWKVASKTEIPALEAHKSGIPALIMAPDGSMMASGAQDGKIFVWEVVFGASQLSTLSGHRDAINSLCFSADSEILVSASSDRTIRLWNAAKGLFIRELDAGCAPYAVAVAPDGKTLYSAGDDQLIRVWDVATGNARASIKGHTGTIASLLITPDGKHLVSGAHDGSIRIWTLGDHKLIRTIARGRGDSDALTLSPDGKILACAGINNTIRLFNFDTGAEIVPAQGHLAPVVSAGLSARSKFVASIDSDGAIRVWDADKSTPLKQWASPHQVDGAVALSPTSDEMISAGGSGDIFVWKLPTGERAAVIPGTAEEHVLSVVYAPSGKQIALGHRSGLVRVWSVEQKRELVQFKYSGPVHTLAFSRDEKLLATSGTSTVVIWDLAAGRELRRFASKEGPPVTQPQVASLSFSPDGNMLALGCYDAVLRLMETASGKKIRDIEGHQSAVLSVDFSADGRTLATGSFDKTVRLWESFSGNPIASFTGHLGPVTSVFFGPRDRIVYSASEDTSLLSWDVPGHGSAGMIKPRNLSNVELDGAWQTLASLDAPSAHPVVWKLVADPEQAVAYLGTHVKIVDTDHIRQLFRDLNHEKYVVRIKAFEELGGYGMWMKGRLETAIKSPPSEEVRRRIEQLLHKLNAPGALTIEQIRLRTHRAMLILEQVGSSEARIILEKLARGAPEDQLQEEARNSLERLKAQ